MMKNNIIIKYLLFTYLISWILWIPGILRTINSNYFNKEISIVLMILGTFAPSIIGFILLKKNKKIKESFSYLFTFRFNIWSISSFFIIPITVFIVHIINNIILNEPLPIISDLYKLPIQFIIILLVFGPLNEEIGWRGLLNSELNNIIKASFSGLLVGITWCIWHIPLFFINEMSLSKYPFYYFFITLILSSIIISIFQKKANSGIWPALFIHTFINQTMEVTPLYRNNNFTIWAIANVILFIIVISFYLIEIFYENKKSHT